MQTREYFQCELRDECLNANWFAELGHLGEVAFDNFYGQGQRH